jgi:hypothetical protein
MIREKNGHFAKGNGGGPGRPKKEREEEYLKILWSILTPARWKVVVKKLLLDAEGGDDKARKLLFDHALGLPIQKLEHTGADSGAIKIKVTLQGDD